MHIAGSHLGGSSARSSARPTTPGGSYRTPPPEQLPECQAALGSRGEFIVDVHTHHVMPSLPWRTTAPDTLRLVLDMVPPDCTAANPLTCVDRAAYLHDMFLASDTTVALLSDLPSTGDSNDPLPFNAADDTWQLARSLTKGGQSRLLLQNVVAPNFGSLAERLDGMTATAETRLVSAFKVYTAWGPGGRGFDLDDPSVGLPVVQHAHDLGVNVICAHKGLPLLNFESTWNQPRDMVAVSRQFSDMQFVVYHAGWTPRTPRVPTIRPTRSALTPFSGRSTGTRCRRTATSGPTWLRVWRSLLADPVQAAHVLGKLLSRLGEDRVLWGTDSVWYGPPQTQIMAFRAFEISAGVPAAVRLSGPDRHGQGEGPRPERGPAVGPGPARHPLRAGGRHPFAQPSALACAGRRGRAAGALGGPGPGHPRADPALAGPRAGPLDTNLTRWRAGRLALACEHSGVLRWSGGGRDRCSAFGIGRGFIGVSYPVLACFSLSCLIDIFFRTDGAACPQDRLSPTPTSRPAGRGGRCLSDPGWLEDEGYLAALAEEDEPDEPDLYQDPDNAPPAGLDDAELAALIAEAREVGEDQGYARWWLGRRGPGMPGSARTFPGEYAGPTAGFAAGRELDITPGCAGLALFAEDAAGPDDRYVGASDDELVGVVCAWDRVEASAAARKHAAVAELIRRRPDPDGAPAAGAGQMPQTWEEFTPAELAPALGESRAAAEAVLDLANDLAVKLPGTRAAFLSGIVTLRKALIIARAVEALDPAEARAAEALVLDRAGRLTPGGLRAAIGRAVMEVAPGKARKRREQAARLARVERWARGFGERRAGRAGAAARRGAGRRPAGHRVGEAAEGGRAGRGHGPAACPGPPGPVARHRLPAPPG